MQMGVPADNKNVTVKYEGDLADLLFLLNVIMNVLKYRTNEMQIALLYSFNLIHII